MKILWGAKDGGPESTVWAWGLEVKGLFSVLLLRFNEGSRDAYHGHAFNSISWLLRGCLYELVRIDCGEYGQYYYPGFEPIYTYRETVHKVSGMHPTNWVLSLRGPWAKTWTEITPRDGEITLTNGRKRV